MNEVKQLREKAGLTQEEAAEKLNINKSTLASYEQDRREPGYKTMDRIRRVLGDGEVYISTATSSDHLRTVDILHAGSPSDASNEDDQIILDERLFSTAGIDWEDHRFARVSGSQLEPEVSHGQIVVVEPTSEVRGQDIYIYWQSHEPGHVAAILSNDPEGLEVITHGPAPGRTLWIHQKGDTYEHNGKTTKIQILGRVLGAFSRPARQIAAKKQAQSTNGHA